MIAFGIVFLQVLCCLGLGAAALRLLKVDAGLDAAEHWAVSFAVGFGILGWLVFPLGIAGFLSQGPLAALLITGSVPAFLLRRSGSAFRTLRPDFVGWALLALIGIVGLFDLAEALAPPADADSLFYHFELPKRFLDAGKIEFILEPLHGAGTFLVQMTYVPVMGLGGERALTLWTMISGWAAAALLFVLCRRHLDVNWSLAVTAIYLTTPTVIFGGGTGQAEPRIVLFVLLAAWATARALETGQARYAVLAGLGAGFFSAAKYTGLLFSVAAGLMIVFQRRWLVCGAAFGVALLAAGFQWYAWNGLHTGDPVFPALFQWLGRDDLVQWSKAYDLVFKEKLFRVENPLPHSPLLLLLFPFKATLDFSTVLGAGRVGFGPYGLLVLPFAVLGLWRFQGRVSASPLLVYGGLALLFYVLWFFLGGSQRIRHLLPVLPLLLICVTVAAQRLTAEGRFRKPLLAAVTATLFLQMAGQGVFSLNHIRFLANGADREAFLERNVNAYTPVPWINANLKKIDRVFIMHRQLRYYLKVPNFFGTFMQGAVELRPEATNIRKLHKQLSEAGITHLLLARNAGGDGNIYHPPLDELEKAGCLISLHRTRIQKKASRTLPSLNSITQILDLLKLKDASCLG